MASVNQRRVLRLQLRTIPCLLPGLQPWGYVLVNDQNVGADARLGSTDHG